MNDLEERKAKIAIVKADDAIRLTESQIFIEAIATLKGDSISEFIGSSDPDQMVELNRDIKAIDKLVNRLNMYIDDGKMALSLLERLKRKINIA